MEGAQACGWCWRSKIGLADPVKCPGAIYQVSPCKNCRGIVERMRRGDFRFHLGTTLLFSNRTCFVEGQRNLRLAGGFGVARLSRDDIELADVRTIAFQLLSNSELLFRGQRTAVRHERRTSDISEPPRRLICVTGILLRSHRLDITSRGVVREVSSGRAPKVTKLSLLEPVLGPLEKLLSHARPLLAIGADFLFACGRADVTSPFAVDNDAWLDSISVSVTFVTAFAGCAAQEPHTDLPPSTLPHGCCGTGAPFRLYVCVPLDNALDGSNGLGYFPSPPTSATIPEVFPEVRLDQDILIHTSSVLHRGLANTSTESRTNLFLGIQSSRFMEVEIIDQE
jgi:hypothetical protein